MQEFKDKVAVITGAASGIGLGIARRCVREGMRVVLADVEQDALSKAQKELAAMGGNVLPVLTDVSKADDVAKLAEKTLEYFGAVHLLCNNAGVSGADGSIWDVSLADWEWAMGVNLWGVIHGLRIFVPIMLAQETEGHIVNTASTAGLLPYHPGVTYHVTKHGVVALSENLYRTLAQQGARVKTSVLCPGFVRTRILSSARNQPVEARADSSAKPLNLEAEEAAWTFLEKEFKVLTPEQVADAVFSAVREEKFYILTHPEFNEAVKNWMEGILQEKNPDTTRLSFRK